MSMLSSTIATMLSNLPSFVVGAATSALAYYFRYALGAVVSFVAGGLGGLFGIRTIKGIWNTTFWKGNDEFKERAEVRQIGPWVWGNITSFDRNRSYRFKGKFGSDILVATFEVDGTHNVLDVGAFSLKLTPDGKTLKGTYAWTEDTKFDLACDRYEWKQTQS